MGTVLTRSRQRGKGGKGKRVKGKGKGMAKSGASPNDHSSVANSGGRPAGVLVVRLFPLTLSPLPLLPSSPLPPLLLPLFRFSTQSDRVFLRRKSFHLGSSTHQPGSQDEKG